MLVQLLERESEREQVLERIARQGARNAFAANGGNLGRIILKGGLDQLALRPAGVQGLIKLKLSGTDLAAARASLPEWADPQSARVLELLQQPYGEFYDYSAKWSLARLERVCREENVPLPGADAC